MVTIRCPHCGLAHASTRTHCPTTGLVIAQEKAGAGRSAELRRTHRGKTRPRTPEDLVGLLVEGKYRVCGIIGQGGMGTVYEAEHTGTRRLVALKVLRPDQLQKKEAVQRFEHEGRVVSAIRHPGICQIFDVGRLEDGCPYMVMERLRGESLADRLGRAGRIAPDELCEIMVDALSALEAAHRQGVVHRDLKPDNIFIGDGKRRSIKVLDFGISKATGLEDAAGSLTRTGMVMGTPYYMAPEQAMGERSLDRRVDVWGAGVVLYEGLTGQRPFVAKNYNALLVQILTAAPPAVDTITPGLPAGLAQVVRHALEKKREARYQSAAELRDALMGLERRAPAPPSAPLREVERVERAPESRPVSRPRLAANAAQVPVAAGSARGISRGTIIGAGSAAAAGPRRGRLPFIDMETEETKALPDESEEEATVVLLRDTDDDTTSVEDSERTEVDPPSFLAESSDHATGAERHRR